MKNQSFFNKKIPTLGALILLICGIGAIASLMGKSNIFQSRATFNEIPQNIRVTNITDTTFTITYITQTATIGSIFFGKDKVLGTVLLDDRDQTNGIIHPSTVHTMTIKNLLPNTIYYFSITSGNKTYANNTIPFTATTGPPIIAQNISPQIISGTTTLPNKTDGSDILVYVQVEHGQVVSTLADKQGNYHISLANLRTPDFLRYLKITPTDEVEITITDGTTTSHIKTLIQNSKKIPAVTLNQEYDFRNSITPSTIPLANTASKFPLFNTTETSENMEILIPRNDENFVDQQPEFRGTAPPNTTVTIIIHSDEAIQTKVNTDNNGQWTFRPANPLSPGTHTITIHTMNTSGETKSLTQIFSILPVGSQVFDTATPAATFAPTTTPIPTSTPIPTLSITPNLTVTPTVTPTVTLTPTLEPTIIPSITPTKVLSVSPTIIATPTKIVTLPATPTVTPTNTQILIPVPTKTPLPSTGNASIIIIGIMSIITTITGIVIFFII